MDEIWLPIAGFEHSYEVSNYGRVRGLSRFVARGSSFMRLNGRMLSGSRAKDGRRMVILHNGDKRLAITVAVLVIRAFGDHQPIGTECCHRDGDASRDHIDNLCWETHAENMRDMIRHGTYSAPPIRLGAENNKAVLLEDDIRCIRAEPDFHGVNVMLSRAFRLRPESIANIRRGLSWKHVVQ